MRRHSLVGPLILIAIGVIFLLKNLRPEFSLLTALGGFWPFLLIGWGGLRLLEILYWASRNKPLPVSGVSGGEWVAIVFLSLIGSGTFFATNRSNWSPMNIRLRGLEMLGEAYDYPIAEQVVKAAGTGPRVVVENLRGNARIAGSDTMEVRLNGRKTVRALDKDRADEMAEKILFEVVQEGETIFIRQPGSHGMSSDDTYVTTDLEITVPKGSRIEARGRRGDFDVTNVSGSVDIDSDNAGVRLQGIGGRVRVETRASDIVRALDVEDGVEIKGSGQDVEVEHVSGQVVVTGNYSGDLQFRSIAKPVRFEGGVKSRGTEWRVESCPGQIRMSRGNLEVENVLGPVQIAARSKDVQVNGFTQSLKLHVDRGDLEVAVGQVPLPEISATTDAGDVQLNIPENARFALKGTADKGEVENEYGSVLNVREEGRGASIAGGVGSGPEITLRTSRGSLRVRKSSAADAPTPPVPPIRPVPPGASSLHIERN